MFGQPFVQVQTKENTKASRHWPFVYVCVCVCVCVGGGGGGGDSLHKGPVTPKIFPFDDAIMISNGGMDMGLCYMTATCHHVDQDSPAVDPSYWYSALSLQHGHFSWYNWRKTPHRSQLMARYGGVVRMCKFGRNFITALPQTNGLPDQSSIRYDTFLLVLTSQFKNLYSVNPCTGFVRKWFPKINGVTKRVSKDRESDFPGIILWLTAITPNPSGTEAGTILTT